MTFNKTAVKEISNEKAESINGGTKTTITQLGLVNYSGVGNSGVALVGIGQIFI